MKIFVNPKWLLFVNTLPVVVLFFLFVGQFNIIKSLLEPYNIMVWQRFGIGLGILALATFFYTLVSIKKKQEIAIGYSIVSLIAYITFLYLYCFYADKIIPFDIPNWMVPNDLTLYVGTFLMPTLIHSLLVLVQKLTNEEKQHSAPINFGIAIVIPFLFYLFSQIVLPLFRIVENHFSVHVIIVLVIFGTLGFLFFLLRGIYILAIKKSAVWKKYELLWKVPFVLIFPLLGLLINNGKLTLDFNHNDSGIFGDFNHPWFYILTVVNGILLCMPKVQHQVYRLIIYIAKCITLSFTTYFFLVFLPFLPLSIIAVIAIGVGFLMLSPLILFVLQTKDISEDYTFLSVFISKRKLNLILIGGFLLIPTLITINYHHHKLVIDQTLDYVYSPDFSKEYDIDKESLQKTIATINKQKEGNREFLFGRNAPFLSSYFNWIVFDNLTLSDKKINTIESVFFGKPSFGISNNDDFDATETNITIQNATVASVYDSKQKVWKSWINLELKNNDSGFENSLYQTNFKLPEGCFISDYYLYVGKKKEKGLLMEKKSAQWVFNQITNENKDPGLLLYKKQNLIEFKIFPFAKNEVRKTGIEFIHKEPIQITIDDKIIALGNEAETIDAKNNSDKNVIYVSAKEKNQLATVSRTPEYHFIADFSKANETEKENVSNKISAFISQKNIDKNDYKIYSSNAYTALENSENWENNFKTKTYEGGFFLELAVKKILFNNYTERSKKQPVIIVVTANLDKAILDKDFSDFSFTFPESEWFYVLNAEGQTEIHSLTNNPKELVNSENINSNNTVVAYPNIANPIAYLPKNNEASIVLSKPVFELEDCKEDQQWETALVLKGQWMTQTLYPEKAKDNWLSAVKNSFISKIMTPQTAYIVVENEAQKAMLIKKQKDVLSGNKNLDLDEETQRMSEPSIYILLLLFLAFLGYKKYRYKL